MTPNESARLDERVPIGPPPPAQSYRDVDALLEAARQTGAGAVHPGYGFLAENSGFARAVADAGLTWIGPDPDSIDDMGDKERARLLAKAAGVPILPGSARFAPRELHGLVEAAAAVGFPLLVKASAGGGGIGMRRVDRPEDLAKVAEATQTLAEKSFGDGAIYLERLVPKARHIEIQVFGFGDGRAILLYERDCSIQRRFQKIVEETPAPRLDPATLAGMAEAAVALCRQERYRGAGTVEFVVDAVTGAFYFLEMNTRIQVEHPVTEVTTGHDLVALQLRLAAGEDLHELTQQSVRRSGHAIECRLYAENPAMNFLPSPGTLKRFRPPPAERGLRIDSGVREGDAITFHYDPMIAKLIAWGEGRDAAIERLRACLSALEVEGVATNAAFLNRTLGHPAFRAGDVHTGFVAEHGEALLKG